MKLELLTHWRKNPAKKRHIKGLARVAVYFTVLGLGCAFVSVRAARAQVAEEGLDLGRQLSRRMNALMGPGEHETMKLRVNGQSLYVSNTVSKDPAKDVLDRFAAHCAENLAQSPREWAGLGDRPGELGRARVAPGEGVIRAGSDRDGMVMCFAKTKDAKPKLADAVKAFAETGDLSALGELRYAFVSTAPNGRTSVLAAWTHERFSVKEMMPPEGTDAPGEDLAGFPRPPRSWRMLSATSEGTGYAMNVYRTDAPPDEVVALYETEVRKLGYTGGLIPFDPSDPKREDKRGLAFANGGALLTVGMRVEDGKTYVATGFAGVPQGMTPGEEITPFEER